MKKEDVLLRLIAISGELPAGLVGEIVESESYVWTTRINVKSMS